LASVFSLLAYVVATGNPNKAFLYLLALPAQPLFFVALLTMRASDVTRHVTIMKFVGFVYCIALASIFVYGMPRAWFY